jgi:thiol-disulfide isomerase/thioredoxin
MNRLVALAIVPTVSVALAAQQALSSATPQDCVRSAREAATKRQREAKPLTAEVFKSITADRVAQVRTCATAFDVEKARGVELAAMVELFSEAQQPELVERAIARGLEPGMLSPAERGTLLANTVRFLLTQPKSAERNARAERYMELIDGLPDDQMDVKVSSHAALNGYYRADDIDAGIVRHSTWLIDVAPRLTPEQRKRFGYQLTNAYDNLAEALAGQGETDRALEVLRRAPKELADIPKVEATLDGTLQRYLLIGTPGAAIKATSWLNTPPGTTSLDMKGAVTLLEFTAHWCGPCKESYPGIQRLRKRFANRPFRVVFATQLYGYFGADRDLTAEQETAKDREYFAGLGLDVPIAIGSRGSSTVDGKPVYTPDPNDAAYKVGGIPQINILDARGNIRLIMVGYDDANEERLGAFIEKLLAEK